MHTHTGYKSNTAYEHVSPRLFGHDLPSPGVTHACNYLDTVRYVGDRYKSLCGKVMGGKYAIQYLSAGLKVTCRKCLSKMRKQE